LTGLLSQLLAPGLFGAEVWDEGQIVVIHPQENIHVERSTEKRRREFALGRACARAAMTNLGHGDAVIAKGEDGAPLWPPGVIGSITHTQGYAAALIAESRKFAGVGIDAERLGVVTKDLWPRLFTAVEQEFLKVQSEPWLFSSIVFCAKEASYKAWAQKGALTFRETEVSLEEGGFVAVRSSLALHGRYAVKNGMVLVIAACPR
jgi:4'-phosphopantetheinyl transferase EntD